MLILHNQQGDEFFVLRNEGVTELIRADCYARRDIRRALATELASYIQGPHCAGQFLNTVVASMEANSLITEDDVKGRYAVFMDMELLYTALPRREGLRATTPTTCKEAATQGYFHDEYSLVFRVDEFASLTSTDLIEQLERVQDAQLAFPELDPAVTHAATATAVARPAAPRARLVAHMTDNVSTDEVKDDGHSALLALPEGEASDNANGGQVATRTQRREDGPSRPQGQLTGAQRREARACAEELHTSRLAYLADLHVLDDDTEADSCGDQLFALGEERLAVLDKGVTADGRLLDHAVHRTQLSRGPQGQRRPGNDVCYACGKRGHWARECRAGKRTAQDATRPPATLAALSALQRQLLPMQGPLALDEGL